MSPTYTMSHHLWSQIYTSWRQTHPQASPEQAVLSSPGMPSPTAPSMGLGSSYFQQRSTSPKRCSMDSNRSDSPPATSVPREQKSSSGWNSR